MIFPLPHISGDVETVIKKNVETPLATNIFHQVVDLGFTHESS